MSIELLKHLIQHYGYLALFIGTFLEGETILLLAGFAAHNPAFHLDLPLVILAAFAGSLAGDQAAFFIGRYWGKKCFARNEKWRSRADRIHALLKRYHEILILSFRFFYGLRNLTPFVLGSSDICIRKFFFLNAIGAAVWSVIFAFIGYVFGSLLESVLTRIINNVHHVEIAIFAVAALVIFLLWLRKAVFRRK